MPVGGGQLIQQVHDEGITRIAQSVKSKLLLLKREFCEFVKVLLSWNWPSTLLHGCAQI